MSASSAFHGTTSSISCRNTSRRVFLRLPAYSASEKLICPIALAPSSPQRVRGMVGGLVQTFPKQHARAQHHFFWWSSCQQQIERVHGLCAHPDVGSKTFLR